MDIIIHRDVFWIDECTGNIHGLYELDIPTISRQICGGVHRRYTLLLEDIMRTCRTLEADAADLKRNEALCQAIQV